MNVIGSLGRGVTPGEAMQYTLLNKFKTFNTGCQAVFSFGHSRNMSLCTAEKTPLKSFQYEHYFVSLFFILVFAVFCSWIEDQCKASVMTLPMA
jgi:hypothetical protein